MSNILKGYMKILAATLQADGLAAIYTEEWRSSKKRYRLFNKPRRYVIHIYLVANDGDKQVTKFAPNTKLDKYELSQIIHLYLNQAIAENEDCLDFSKSYLTIRA